VWKRATKEAIYEQSRNSTLSGAALASRHFHPASVLFRGGSDLNRYDRYPGDYLRQTLTLTFAQDGVYTRLLDYYYSTEKPIPVDEVMAAVRCRSAEDEAVTQWVLDRFFTLTEMGYRHDRADKEIAKAQPRIEAARNNGLRGGRPQKKPSGLANGLASGEPSENPDRKLPSPSPSPKAQKQEHAPSNQDCSPPAADAPPLPLVDGSEAVVTEQDMETWEDAFPAVDVLQELRKIRAWLIANPRKRKTKAGWRKSVMYWLGSEQDKGRRTVPVVAEQPRQLQEFR
jgi:uncharacterized protein YdaU (DUF1376 family)